MTFLTLVIKALLCQGNMGMLPKTLTWGAHISLANPGSGLPGPPRARKPQSQQFASLVHQKTRRLQRKPMENSFIELENLAKSLEVVVLVEINVSYFAQNFLILNYF